MPKVCGQAVHVLWLQLGQLKGFSAASFRSIFACVKNSAFTHLLSNFCTQLSPTRFSLSTSVISNFYPLSTHPITTTTII